MACAAVKSTAEIAATGRLRVAAGKNPPRMLLRPHLPSIPLWKMGAFKGTPDSLPVFRITVPFGRIRFTNKPMLICRRYRRIKFSSNRRPMPAEGFPGGTRLNLRFFCLNSNSVFLIRTLFKQQLGKTPETLLPAILGTTRFCPGNCRNLLLLLLEDKLSLENSGTPASGRRPGRSGEQAVRNGTGVGGRRDGVPGGRNRERLSRQR